MKAKLLTVLAGVLCAVSCARLETAQMPREEYVRQYTKTGGVLSREKFADPPIEARGNPFWAIPNGFIDTDQVTRELEEMKNKGLGGAAYWDTGPGPHSAGVPAGPAFMGPESTKAIAHTIREGTRLGLELCVRPVSSWNAGGSWVTPEDASKAVYLSQTEVEGPKVFAGTLPFPQVPRAPKGADGLPVFYKDIAVLAVPEREVPAHEFVFEPAQGKTYTLDRAVIYNFGGTDNTYYSKDFSTLTSTTTAEDKAFKEIVRGELRAETGPQTFTFDPTPARYVKLQIRSGYRTDNMVELSEFEVYSAEGKNVVAAQSGGKLVSYSSARAKSGDWSAPNINDGMKNGPAGSWSSAELRKTMIEDMSSIMDLSDRLGKNGRLTWDVPEGKWTILRFVCSNTGQRLNCPSPNSDGLILDHLSAGAIRRHFQYIYDRILAKLGGKDFEATSMLFEGVSSYEVRSTRAWTDRFSEEFKKRRGYDITRYLPVLFGWTVQNREMTDRFMYDWRKTVSDLLVDYHYKTYREVCHEYGLLLRGESGGPGGAAEGLKALGALDIPQGEFWVLPNKLYFVKQIACAAHIYGKKIVDAEAFTGSRHWELGPFEYKPYADRAMYEGLNRFCYHNMTHAHPQGGLPGWVFGWGEHFSVNDTWWAKSKPFHHDYLARACYMLQQGLFVGDVCYYYGDHGGAQVGPKNSGNPIDIPYVGWASNAHRIFPGLPKTPDPSLGFGYGYDVCNPEVILTRMSVKDGRIVLPDGMSYELLVLPNRQDIDWEVLQKLDKLIKAGATVVGSKPTRTNTLTDFPKRDEKVRRLADKIWGPCDGKTVKEHAYGKGRVVWGRTLRELLQERGLGPDFSFTGADDKTDIEFIHRRTANEDIYYVVNKNMRAEDVECTFRVKGKQPELWITDDASIRKVMVYDSVEGGTRVPLRLAPAGSVFVVFRKESPKDHIVSATRNGTQIYPDGLRAGQDLAVLDVLDAKAGDVTLLAWQPGEYVLRTAQGDKKKVDVETVPSAHEIAGPWEVHFPEGWGAPKSKVFEKLISWTEDSHKDIKHFSGTATYHKEFTLPANLAGQDLRLVLDLGEVHKIADIWLNGKQLGILWKPPFRVDISKVVKPGKNTLKIELTNLWRNRLIGDANLPKEQRKTNTNIPISGNAPLLKSGLLGPVRVLAVKEVSF